ncbi:MAG: 4Fe-4S dicluster domain-containing protein [Anaeromyxobacteraceae bacterium]
MYIPLRRIPRYDDPRESTWGLVHVEAASCHGCSLCARACPSRVLEVVERRARVRTVGVVQCMACGACTAICPTRSIALLRSYSFSDAYETLEKGPLLPPRL